MKKTLLKTIKLYSDGSYEEISEKSEETKKNEMNRMLDDIFSNQAASRRVKFNVAAFIVAKDYHKKGNKNAINDALSLLAEYENVTRQTVVDKTFRQLSITSEKYKVIMAEAICENGNIEELKTILLNNAGSRTEASDKEMIEKYLKP